MKRLNIRKCVAFAAALITTPAFANTSGKADLSRASSAEVQQLVEIDVLLQQLSNAHALEIDDEGNVRVRKSIAEQLRIRGRLTTTAGSFGSICN